MFHFLFFVFLNFVILILFSSHRFSLNIKSFDSMFTFANQKNYQPSGHKFMGLYNSPGLCKMDRESSLILQNSLTGRTSPGSVDVSFLQSIFVDCTDTNKFLSFHLFRKIDLSIKEEVY